MDRTICARIGRRIRYTRWVSGMSQDELARRIGICRETLRSYEAGLARPSTELLFSIADAQSVPVSHYFEMPENLADEKAEFLKLH